MTDLATLFYGTIDGKEPAPVPAKLEVDETHYPADSIGNYLVQAASKAEWTKPQFERVVAMIDKYDRFPSESELYSLGLNMAQIDGMAEGLEEAFLEDVSPLIEPDEEDEAEPNLFDEDEADLDETPADDEPDDDEPDDNLEDED